ncbi:AurF N-oxygenase family protein [Smaragdicoccus niigatensis]|uniref:AurF N-oxygenase family protein n=1 Tax=Smaragdicoccus niigatensis TaxID=359359 RepID=UPI00037BBF6F|nr:diiron oxygenase [Smaragdicoccus niigatensis]
MTLTAEQTYHERLRTLSEGSVHRSFDAYKDIDWDNPDWAVDPTDARWVLPKADPLGGHAWYLAQPLEKQIAIGMWRQANIARVGLHFEQLLIRGFMQYNFGLENGNPEFRYITHESAEECNHSMMFQEMVNRIGADVPGMDPISRLLTMAIWPAVSFFPEWFFIMILGGEEPIDHLQKEILRGSDTMHPMVTRVMQIHVAEEARHISFAHEYIKLNVPKAGFIKKAALSVLMPATFRVMAEMIATPPRQFREEFDIPAEVINELYWSGETGKSTLQGIFGDVRALAHEAGLINPVSKLVWKVLGIDGRPSRYRSEPAPVTENLDNVVELTRSA